MSSSINEKKHMPHNNNETRSSNRKHELFGAFLTESNAGLVFAAVMPVDQELLFGTVRYE